MSMKSVVSFLMAKRSKVAATSPPSNGLNIWALIVGASLLALLVAALFFIPRPDAPSIVLEIPKEAETISSLRAKIEKLGITDSQDQKKRSLYSTLYRLDRTSLTEADLAWMGNSEFTDTRTMAADAYYKRGESDKAIPLLEASILDTTANSDVLSVAYDDLAQIYIEKYDRASAGRVLKEAIDRQISYQYANRWYGFYLQTLLDDYKLEEVREVVQECYESFRHLKGLVPFHCYHEAAMLAMFEGDIRGSLQIFYKLYREVLMKWRDESGSICPATFVPLAKQSSLPGIAALQKEIILESDMQIDTNRTFSTRCSAQNYPYMVSPAEKGSYKLRNRTNAPATDFIKMGCFTSDEKKAVLRKITDVTVLGEFKLISKKSDDGCVFYSPGMPFLNSLAQPRYNGMNIRYEDLPIKELENVLILHFLDVNYYHLTIEGISKVILSRFNPLLRDVENLRILCAPSHPAEQLFRMLGVLPMAEMYEPTKFRYHIDNLYVIDWTFDDESLPDASSSSAVALRRKDQHIEDYYVPPTDILRLTRTVLLELIPEDLYWQPRNEIIFLHRSSGSRTVQKPLPLYQSLSYIAQLHGLELRLHGVESDSISSQIDLFSRAVAVVGIHGAGFTNMIYCKPGTAIIELPVAPEKVSVYSRMASAFNFPYYTVPSTSFYHFQSIVEFTRRMQTDTEDTLYRALADQGYEPYYGSPME